VFIIAATRKNQWAEDDETKAVRRRPMAGSELSVIGMRAAD